VTSIQQIQLAYFYYIFDRCSDGMKNLTTIALLTGVMMAGFSFQMAAQTRAEKTSSAKAYYGHTREKSKFKKKKKQKPVMVHHTKPASGTHIDAWNSRKKYSRS
jgi:hypothetical protein